MNSKIKGLNHFTSLIKRPLKGNGKKKYPTSTPSPVNSPSKYLNNKQITKRENSTYLIKKKIFNNIAFNNKNNSSSFLKLGTPFNYLYLNNQSKLNNSNKNKMILTSIDNSSIHSKDKICLKMNENNNNSNNNINSYIYNHNNLKKVNSIGNIYINSNFNLFNKNKFITNNINKTKFLEERTKDKIMYFKKRKLSYCPSSKNICFNQKKISQKNINNDNSNYIHQKFNINLLINSKKKNNVNHQKIIISSSPRISFNNIQTNSSRSKKMKNNKHLYNLKNNINTNNNSQNNSMSFGENNTTLNKQKNNSLSKGKISINELKNKNFKLNINSNNNISLKLIGKFKNLKLTKIISQSQKQINQKKQFTNHFLSNNNSNKNTLENKDISSINNTNNKNSNSLDKIIEINYQKLKQNLEEKNYNPNTSTKNSFDKDNFYYQKQSKKLSLYIISYKNKYNEYPETSILFYKYGRLIGQGAFGKVNLGLNILCGRVVAVKSFNKKKLNKKENTKNKIFYEIDLMKKLSHPNITKILEYFESEKYYLIIMEYINGGNLFSFVKKRRKLNEKLAKFLFIQIINGIKYLHSKNIVHRDIKLENILIDVNNNIKICDFGISKILTKKEEKCYDQCGTLMYMAPEILLSNKEKGYNPFLIDIYSAGIALYIMLSGSLPFNITDDYSSLSENNTNNLDLQYKIINNKPKDIENISHEAKDLLNKLLNKNPLKRISCDEILNHPWLKNYDNKNNYHLFTKVEMTLLSKTYIDYRFADIDDIKENFTISNLEIDDNEKIKYNNKENCRTKSILLGPYNSNKDLNNDNDDIDDFDNIELNLENGIILFSNKVKEYNLNYELNNNGELDNGMLINTQSDISNSISSTSRNLNTSNYYYNNYVNDNSKNNINEKDKKEKILNQLQNLGYEKNYVINCLNNNIICHATTVYYLMMNYDNF